MIINNSIILIILTFTLIMISVACGEKEQSEEALSDYDWTINSSKIFAPVDLSQEIIGIWKPVDSPTEKVRTYNDDGTETVHYRKLDVFYIINEDGTAKHQSFYADTGEKRYENNGKWTCEEVEGTVLTSIPIVTLDFYPEREMRFQMSSSGALHEIDGKMILVRQSESEGESSSHIEDNPTIDAESNSNYGSISYPFFSSFSQMRSVSDSSTQLFVKRDNVFCDKLFNSKDYIHIFPDMQAVLLEDLSYCPELFLNMGDTIVTDVDTDGFNISAIPFDWYARASRVALTISYYDQFGAKDYSPNSSEKIIDNRDGTIEKIATISYFTDLVSRGNWDLQANVDELRESVYPIELYQIGDFVNSFIGIPVYPEKTEKGSERSFYFGYYIGTNYNEITCDLSSNLLTKAGEEIILNDYVNKTKDGYFEIEIGSALSESGYYLFTIKGANSRTVSIPERHYIAYIYDRDSNVVEGDYSQPNADENGG